MAKDYRNQIISTYRSSKHCWKTRNILKNDEWVDYLNNIFQNPNMSVADKLRLLDTGHTSIPKCSECGRPVNFFGKKTCSIECRNQVLKKTAKARHEKGKQTLLERYGVDNISKIAK